MFSPWGSHGSINHPTSELGIYLGAPMEITSLEFPLGLGMVYLVAVAQQVPLPDDDVPLCLIA